MQLGDADRDPYSAIIILKKKKRKTVLLLVKNQRQASFSGREDSGAGAESMVGPGRQPVSHCPAVFTLSPNVGHVLAGFPVTL